MKSNRICRTSIGLSVLGVLGIVTLLSACGQGGGTPEQSKTSKDQQTNDGQPATGAGQASPAKAPPLVVAPFDAETAKKHQQAWADHVGASVQVTNSLGMKLKRIPAGEFLMGSPETEANRRADEYQHRVRITKPFYLGVYEVTQGEYERVMGTNPSSFAPGGDGKDQVSAQDTSRFPVENVSWEDAVEFCRTLSALPAEQSVGRVYRLPTEAEWEYACRAGTTTPFHFGATLNGREANCCGNYPYGTKVTGMYLRRTTTVGSYGANAFGLYNMHGNVEEWCQDWCEAEYYRRSPVDDPQGPTTDSIQVFRGGCWISLAWFCRAAYRGGDEPSRRCEYVGFRVALVPPGR